MPERNDSGDKEKEERENHKHHCNHIIMKFRVEYWVRCTKLQVFQLSIITLSMSAIVEPSTVTVSESEFTKVTFFSSHSKKVKDRLKFSYLLGGLLDDIVR